MSDVKRLVLICDLTECADGKKSVNVSRYNEGITEDEGDDLMNALALDITNKLLSQEKQDD